MDQEYNQLFSKAIEQTKNLGLSVPESAFRTTEPKILTDDIAAQVANAFSDAFNEWSNDDFVCQCMLAHIIFQPHLEQIINHQVTFTVGYIKGETQSYFVFTEDDARKWIADGTPKANTELHAWLTLPSGEVLDLTFPLTYAKYNSLNFPRGAMIADYSSNLNGMKYIPMYLGIDFLKAIGAMKYQFYI